MKKPLFFISVSAAVVLASVALVSCFDRNTGDKWESTSSKIATDDVDIDKLPKESFALLPPPQVPPPITRKSPARVAIEVEVREVVLRPYFRRPKGRKYGVQGRTARCFLNGAGLIPPVRERCGTDG